MIMHPNASNPSHYSEHTRQNAAHRRASKDPVCHVSVKRGGAVFQGPLSTVRSDTYRPRSLAPERERERERATDGGLMDGKLKEERTERRT